MIETIFTRDHLIETTVKGRPKKNVRLDFGHAENGSIDMTCCTVAGGFYVILKREFIYCVSLAMS